MDPLADTAWVFRIIVVYWTVSLKKLVNLLNFVHTHMKIHQKCVFKVSTSNLRVTYSILK